MLHCDSIRGLFHIESFLSFVGLKQGKFVEDQSLKCYTLCVQQMTGTLNKKNDVSEQKAMSQLNLMPPELKDHMMKVFDICKDAGKGYKDPCDKTFYNTKCFYDLDPEKFLFP